MSFFGEIASVLGFDEARLALGYSYVVYNGEAVYVEGIKKVLRLDESEIAFLVNKGVLYVGGEGLTVSDLSGATALVRGSIEAVYTSAAVDKKTKVEEKKP